MKGNGDGKIEIGVVPIANRWMIFRPGITPTTRDVAGLDCDQRKTRSISISATWRASTSGSPGVLRRNG